MAIEEGCLIGEPDCNGRNATRESSLGCGNLTLQVGR
jgi:hypothetical protein